MKTRSGAEVKVFDFNSGGDYPILGAYFNGEEWIPVKWNERGQFPSINDDLVQCALDIVDFEDEEDAEA